MFLIVGCPLQMADNAQQSITEVRKNHAISLGHIILYALLK